MPLVHIVRDVPGLGAGPIPGVPCAPGGGPCEGPPPVAGAHCMDLDSLQALALPGCRNYYPNDAPGNPCYSKSICGSDVQLAAQQKVYGGAGVTSPSGAQGSIGIPLPAMPNTVAAPGSGAMDWLMAPETLYPIAGVTNWEMLAGAIVLGLLLFGKK